MLSRIKKESTPAVEAPGLPQCQAGSTPLPPEAPGTGPVPLGPVFRAAPMVPNSRPAPVALGTRTTPLPDQHPQIQTPVNPGSRTASTDSGCRPSPTINIGKSINVTYHINKIKDRNHNTISRNVEKSFDKIQHPLTIKKKKKHLSTS